VLDRDSDQIISSQLNSITSGSASLLYWRGRAGHWVEMGGLLRWGGVGEDKTAQAIVRFQANMAKMRVRTRL